MNHTSEECQRLVIHTAKHNCVLPAADSLRNSERQFWQLSCPGRDRISSHTPLLADCQALRRTNLASSQYRHERYLFMSGFIIPH